MTLLRILCALLLVALLPAGLACEPGKLDVPDKFPDLPKVDVPNLSLPKKGSHFSLIETSAGGIQLNPASSDAITALGTCTDLITYCYEPGARSLDACVEAVPRCRTSKPWEEADCCPSACVDAYSRARSQGQEPIAAFEKALFLEPDCFPGVRALLEGR
jgi:hypothetical protein